MIKIYTATLFSNGDQETIDLNIEIQIEELENYRRELSAKHNKHVYFTYKTIK